MLTIAAVGIVTGRLVLLPAALVVGYGIAWLSHFAIERNRPASWGRPAWSFRGDMQLIGGYFTARCPRRRRGAARTRDARGAGLLADVP